MGWRIIDQRLALEEDAKIRFPDANEIFDLRKNLPDGKIVVECDDTLSRVDYVRFSRIGLRIVLKIDFDNELNTILLKCFSQKGSDRYELSYNNYNLQDSIIINHVWYNLLTNHSDTSDLLLKANIFENGEITIGQYIKIKQQSRLFSSVEIDDSAETVLSHHPVKSFTQDTPASLNAVLYPYQITGFQWMKFITDEKIGCILGDEMGLGKTLQVIALIVHRRSSAKSPALVIAPVSLLENWKREFERFTVGIKVYIHHGSDRTGLYQDLTGFDAVIISYNTACSDLSLLKMITWDLIVLDEAQNIKNPSARRTLSVKKIPRSSAVAVTGTPFENHITDLWSILDFIAPGCYGTLAEFESAYTDDIKGAVKLEPLLTPLMIRRKVSEVAGDLPVRVDIPQVLQMSSNEAFQYEEERSRILSSFDGINASLPMLQKLRMFCTHPALLNETVSLNPVIGSSKYQRLCEILEEIVLLKEKVILFTSFNKMFQILKEDIPYRFGIKVLLINGATPVSERQNIVDTFSSIQGSALLVLNPRAAGVGLNITAASRVIHYNLEWNPSLEDQASARAYRRGQNRTVFIYRLYYRNTVEEVINDRIERKRNMFNKAVIGVDGNFENSDDIIRALQLSPKEDIYE